MGRKKPDPSEMKPCMRCGQPFKPKIKTNRICNRRACKRARSKPGMYVEPIRDPDAPSDLVKLD